MHRLRSIVVFPLKPAYLSAMEFDRKESAAYLANLLAKAASRALQARADGTGFAPGQFPVLLHRRSQRRPRAVSRRRHPKDKRAQLVFLTTRGKALRETAMAAASATEDALFQGFRRFERELLLEYMRMVLANLGRDPRL